MNRLDIMVTGAGGFLGSTLCHHWQRAGHRVQGTFRHARRAAAHPQLAARHVLPLGETPNAELFHGCHALVHTAYDGTPGPHRLQRNVSGTIALAEAARRAGVPQQVYISSYSAHAHGTSDYAQVKVLLEDYFRRLQACVVRPALIIGRGGLCGRMLKLVQRMPCVPLLDGGHGPVAMIGVHDVAQALDGVLQQEVPPAPEEDGAYNLASGDTPSMRTLLQAMGAAMGRRVRFVHVPLSPVLALTAALERLHVPLPVSSENLRGYRVNRALSRVSHCEMLGVQPSGLAAVLAACV